MQVHEEFGVGVSDGPQQDLSAIPQRETPRRHRLRYRTSSSPTAGLGAIAFLAWAKRRGIGRDATVLAAGRQWLDAPARAPGTPAAQVGSVNQEDGFQVDSRRDQALSVPRSSLIYHP